VRADSFAGNSNKTSEKGNSSLALISDLWAWEAHTKEYIHQMSKQSISKKSWGDYLVAGEACW
jgi:hypothetical protein